MEVEDTNSTSFPPNAPAVAESEERIYHMCQKELWDQAIAANYAYFPPTFQKDGCFTHATLEPSSLIATANHFYTSVPGEWICVELSNSAMAKLGIVTIFEEAKAVGDTEAVATSSSPVRFPHIYGGIPAHVPGISTGIYSMERNAEGKFLSITGLSDN